MPAVIADCRGARERLAGAATRWHCAISSLEIALKHQQGKLELPLSPLRWLQALEDRYSLSELSLDSALCAAAARLPPHHRITASPHHRDPCDRFIIAAALRLQVPVITSDPKFAPYGVEVVS